MRYIVLPGVILLVIFGASSGGTAQAGSQVCKTTTTSVYDPCCSQPQVYNNCCSSYTVRYVCGSTYTPPTCEVIQVCTPIQWATGQWTCEWLGETRTVCSGGGYIYVYCTDTVCQGCYQAGPCQGCYRDSSVQTCNLLPDAPTPLAPDDWATAIGDARLIWSGNDPDNGPASPIDYQVFIRSSDGRYQRTANFGSGLSGVSGQSVSYYFNPELSGTFYWKVRAWDGYTDASGNPVYSDYSPERILVVDYNCGV